MRLAPQPSPGLDVSGWHRRLATFCADDRVPAARALVARLESKPHLSGYLAAARRMLARFEAATSGSDAAPPVCVLDEETLRCEVCGRDLFTIAAGKRGCPGKPS